MSSKIFLIDVDTKKVRKELVFHQRGIQSMAFGYKDKLLFSVGVKEVNCLAVHSVEYFNVVYSANIMSHTTNKIVVQASDDAAKDERVTWVTLGNQGSLILWEIMFDPTVNVEKEIRESFPNTEVQKFDYTSQCPNEELRMTNFLSAAFRKDDKMIIGCHDGTVCGFELTKGNERFIDDGRKVQLKPRGAITQVKCGQNNQIVLGNENGIIFNYSIPPVGQKDILPPEDEDKITITELKENNISAGCITAMHMTDNNEEGMVGTTKGMIFYVCLKDGKDNKQTKTQIKLVGKVAPALEDVDIVRFDPANPKVFMASCGASKSEIKLLSSMTMDTVYTFKSFQTLGPVRFITSNRARKADHRMIGYAHGTIRFVSLNELEDKEWYKVDLERDLELEREEELTCGCFNANGSTWAVGTSFGSIIIGVSQKDLFRKHQGYLTTRIDGRVLMETREFSVTSLQMTKFDPNGSILASFSNGEVKLWKSHITPEKFKKITR